MRNLVYKELYKKLPNLYYSYGITNQLMQTFIICDKAIYNVEPVQTFIIYRKAIYNIED